MFKILYLFATVSFVACSGSPLQEPLRNAKLNTYHVYTRQNPRDPFVVNEDNIGDSPILLARDTIVIVHGHGGSAFTSLNPIVKDAFLYNGDVNVIVVDWSTYAHLSYSNAVAFTPSIGVNLAEFIELLVDANRVALTRLHLVGFNLGAHAVGFAGRELKGRVARITGLDPSARQWENNPQRLSITDALYVEVIHTDGHGIGSNGLGVAIGHVDFFANGGSNQPGCIFNSCSHNRAYELFAASLTHGKLIGNQCNTKLQLSMNLCRGYSLELGTNAFSKFGSGIFRVNTGRTYPY